QDITLHLAASHDLHRRNAQTLLIDLFAQSHGTGMHAADVCMMRTRSNIKRRRLRAIEQYRHHQSDVRKMSAAAKWVIEHGDVSALEFEIVNRGAHRHWHRPEMH